MPMVDEEVDASLVQNERAFTAFRSAAWSMNCQIVLRGWPRERDVVQTVFWPLEQTPLAVGRVWLGRDNMRNWRGQEQEERINVGQEGGR